MTACRDDYDGRCAPDSRWLGATPKSSALGQLRKFGCRETNGETRRPISLHGEKSRHECKNDPWRRKPTESAMRQMAKSAAAVSELLAASLSL
jgi:hypothetical protein